MRCPVSPATRSRPAARPGPPGAYGGELVVGARSPSDHAANPRLKASTPSSPARRAVGSGTPRATRAAVIAAARPTLLRASRSWSSALAATAAFSRGAELAVHRAHRARGALEAGGDRLERAGARGRLGDALGQQPAQRLLAGDQQLALVGEVPEEGALGDPGALGDLRDRRGVVPLLGEQVDGRQDEAFARSWFPPSHGAILCDGTVVPSLCYGDGTRVPSLQESVHARLHHRRHRPDRLRRRRRAARQRPHRPRPRPLRRVRAGRRGGRRRAAPRRLSPTWTSCAPAPLRPTA